MRLKILIVLAALSGCASTTPEGCPVMLSEIGQVEMQACIAAHNEEKARAAGGVATRCTPVGTGLSCVNY